MTTIYETKVDALKVMLRGVIVRCSEGRLYGWNTEAGQMVNYGKGPDLHTGGVSQGYGWRDASGPFTEFVARTEPLEISDIIAELERRAALFDNAPHGSGYAGCYREAAEMLTTRKYARMRG